MIDIVEGRMIVTNTLIGNDTKTKNEMDFLIVIEEWVDWIWDLESDEIDVIQRDICDVDEMMNRERKQRNRELLLKIRIMKETDFKNPVWHKGGWMKKGMNMINTN